MNRSFVVFTLIMLTLISSSAVVAPHASADWLIDASGTIMKIDASVLGDDDVRETEVEDENEVREDKRKNNDNNQEVLKKRAEKVREETKKNLERKIELNKRLNQNIENKYELTAKDGELKIKQKTRSLNGEEKETEIEIKKAETLHVDQEDGKSLTIDAVKSGELEIKKNKFSGRTRLPISVNSNNELIVTRPDGSTKVVTVLPDQAIEKMVEKGLMEPGTLDLSTENLELTTDTSGEPVYKVKKEMNKKVLGLFPMKFSSETSISATDSELVESKSTETNRWRKFLERLAL